MLSMRIAGYRRLCEGALMATLLTVGACDDDPLDPTEGSRFGEVEVDVSTTGYEPDFAGGYVVSLEGGGPVAIDVLGEVVLYGAPAGSRTVVLSGLPANCTAPTNPATVNVSARERAHVSFEVTCAAVTGGIRPQFTLTGAAEDIDQDVTLTVFPATPLAADSADFVVNPSSPEELLNFAPGPYWVAFLEDAVAPNCVVADPVEIPVFVDAGATADADFAIDCAPNVGNLTVNVSTAGTNPDDGYAVTVGDAEPVLVGASGASEFNLVRVGSVTVVLGDVAANCSVQGNAAGQDAEAQTTVVFGEAEMATVAFAVLCE